MAKCPSCENGMVKCKPCNGKGKVDKGTFVIDWQTCEHCNGHGKVRCSNCNGTGQI